jgi:hypothetical protein
LIVTGVAYRDGRAEGGEKFLAGAAGFLFAISTGGGGVGSEKGERESGRKGANETLVFVGGFGAPVVIEVGDTCQGRGVQLL